MIALYGLKVNSYYMIQFWNATFHKHHTYRNTS